MSDLFDLSVAVSTPGAPIELNDGVEFELAAWNPPIQQVSRTTESGPYQSGEVLIAAARTAGTISAVVRVLGSTWPAQQANVASLFSALSQWSFVITESVEGVARIYECMPTDIALANGISGEQVAYGAHEYVLSIPCNPPYLLEGS